MKEKSAITPSSRDTPKIMVLHGAKVLHPQLCPHPLWQQAARAGPQAGACFDLDANKALRHLEISPGNQQLWVPCPCASKTCTAPSACCPSQHLN